MHGNGDGTLISLAQEVHLLSVLPSVASRIAGARLDEGDVVLPNGARVLVVADDVQAKVVGLGDCLASLAGGIGHDVVAASNVVEVDAPELDVVVLEEGDIEDVFQANQVVEF